MAFTMTLISSQSHTSARETANSAAHREPRDTTAVAALSPWVCLSLALPLIGRSMTVSATITVAAMLALGWCLGTVLLARCTAFWEMSQVTRSGVAIILGTSLLFAVATSVPSAESSFAVVLVGGGAGAYCSRRRYVDWRGAVDPRDLSLFLLAIILGSVFAIASGDALRGLATLPSQTADPHGDAAYFTAIVVSLAHSSPNSAYFAAGLPIAYTVIPFVAPAVLAQVSHASAQATLWGVWMPLLTVASLMLVADVGLRLLPKSVGNGRFTSAILLILFAGLQPLNPRRMLTLNFKLFVWGGLGFLGPGGNVPSTAAIAWSLLALALLLPRDLNRKSNTLELCAAMLVLITLPAVKIPAFITVGSVVTCVAILRALRRDRRLLVLLAAAILPAIEVYRLAWRGSAGSVAIRFGFLTNYLTALVLQNTHGSSVALMGALLIVILFALWGGWRWLGIAYLLKNRQNRHNKNGFEASAGVLLSFLISILVANSLALTARASISLDATDKSFDLLQFPRAAFLLLSVAAPAGIVALTNSLTGRRFAKAILLAATILWCAIGLGSIGSNASWQVSVPNGWLIQARAELAGHPAGLMAIDPTESTPGLLLVASGLGPFWVSQLYPVVTDSTRSRALLFQALLAPGTQQEARGCGQLRAAGVRIIVATPKSESAIARASGTCPLARAGNDRWVWVLR